MTREVAIKAIQDFIGWFKPDSRIYKALNMAISAMLENEELSKDLDEALEEIDRYERGLTQEPCDVCKYKTFTELYFHTDPEMLEQEPCETCGYAEGSPFCLQYCTYDAERKKEQEPCIDALIQLKKYTEGKQNTDKVEISVLAPNRIIKALEQEPMLEKIFNIVHPLSIMSTDKLEHEAIMQIAEMLEPLYLLESEG